MKASSSIFGGADNNGVWTGEGDADMDLDDSIGGLGVCTAVLEIKKGKSIKWCRIPENSFIVMT